MEPHPDGTCTVRLFFADDGGPLMELKFLYPSQEKGRALAERLGIPREKVMALGDNGNDVTMLQYAGVSVAMGDGSPEAKAAARCLTAPHDQNGLAQAVRRYALS